MSSVEFRVSPAGERYGARVVSTGKLFSHFLKTFRERAGHLKRKRHTHVWRFRFELSKFDLDGLFGEPVGQLQIASNFAPLITMFHGFLGVTVGFSEGMFGISDCFIDRFQCFHHSSNPFTR